MKYPYPTIRIQSIHDPNVRQWIVFQISIAISIHRRMPKHNVALLGFASVDVPVFLEKVEKRKCAA